MGAHPVGGQAEAGAAAGDVDARRLKGAHCRAAPRLPIEHRHNVAHIARKVLGLQCK